MTVDDARNFTRASTKHIKIHPIDCVVNNLPCPLIVQHAGIVVGFLLCADIMELKRMMEKLGQAKTHLELKKMIAEVDTTNSGGQRERERERDVLVRKRHLVYQGHLQSDV